MLRAFVMAAALLPVSVLAIAALISNAIGNVRRR